MSDRPLGNQAPRAGMPWQALVGLGVIVAAAAALMLPSKGMKNADAVKTGDAGIAGPLETDGPSETDRIVAELRVAPRSDASAATAPAVVIKPDDVAVFMRAKLDHAQDVIEGLATEDFQAIYRAAHDLALASQASTWEVLLTEEYARQSADFRRSCESLRTAARDENLDAAALAWMDVTLKCVQCHKYVRQADRADARQ